MMRLIASLGRAVACASLTVGAAVAVDVDPAISEYKPVAGLSGTLSSIGSDTLNNLMTFWAEAFGRLYPNVNIQVEGKGSATAPPALANGTAQLGPMSREMKKEEIDAFEKKFGYKPTAYKVAIDALAVFVHKDNPVTSLDFTQVDAIFSSTFKRGGKPIESWGALGLTGEWAAKPISLYGRNSASGTYGYFKEHALSKGDYKSSVKEQPGSSAVVQGVANDVGGIGYSGIGYVTAGVKALPLAAKAGEAPVEPTYENAKSGKYPLSRFLFIYVNKKPDGAMDPVVAEFIRFVLAKGGQEIVLKDGYFPLDHEQIDAQLGTAKK